MLHSLNTFYELCFLLFLCYLRNFRQFGGQANMYKFIISWKRVVNSLRVSNVSLTVDATKYFTGYVSNSKSFPVVRTKVRGAVTWAGFSWRCCFHKLSLLFPLLLLLRLFWHVYCTVVDNAWKLLVSQVSGGSSMLVTNPFCPFPVPPLLRLRARPQCHTHTPPRAPSTVERNC